MLHICGRGLCRVGLHRVTGITSQPARASPSSIRKNAKGFTDFMPCDLPIIVHPWAIQSLQSAKVNRILQFIFIFGWKPNIPLWFTTTQPTLKVDFPFLSPFASLWLILFYRKGARDATGCNKSFHKTDAPGRRRTKLLLLTPASCLLSPCRITLHRLNRPRYEEFRHETQSEKE